MRKNRSLVVGMTMLSGLAGGACTTAVRGPAELPVARQIEWRAQRPIADELRPDDVLVHVFHPDGSGQAWARGASARDVLSATLAMQEGQLLIVIEAADALGQLTRDGSWVETTVTGSVDELLFVPYARTRSYPQRGSTIKVKFTGGGETTIGKTVVRAGDAPVFEPGSRYLMFLDDSVEGDVPRIADNLPLKIDSRLRLRNVAPLHSEMEGLTLKDVRAALAARKQQTRAPTFFGQQTRARATCLLPRG